MQFCGRVAFVTYSVLVRCDSQHQQCLASMTLSCVQKDLYCKRVNTLSRHVCFRDGGAPFCLVYH